MPNKQNDLFAALMYNPTTLEDLYAHGITPENTGFKEKDYYKNIDAVKKQFTDKNGEFAETEFNAFYDSVSRMYTEFQNEDFTNKVIDLIETSPLDWTDLNRKRYDVDAIVHITHLPNKATMGLSNIWDMGSPTFTDSEIAQSKKVLDVNGKELDYTPNDMGGIFKGIMREPMALAIWESDGTHMENGVMVEHKKGDLWLDEDGDPRYQILGNKNAAGRHLLNYWDTATIEGEWINKYDFMDSDGFDKSVTGTVAKTVFQIAPYFIPYVGPVYKYLMAGKELATAMPMFLNAIHTATGGSNDDEFGQQMNAWANQMSSWKSGMSLNGQSNFFSLENISNIIASSFGQIHQQRAVGELARKLGSGTKLRQQLSLSYMALTSGQDSYNIFKEAGASDQVAGIGAIASIGALYGLMNIDYFKSWLFNGTWLDENRVLIQTLKEVINRKQTKWKFIKSGIKNASEAKGAFNTIRNTISDVWNDLFTVEGAVGNAFKEYTARMLNEGVEETMEEAAVDIVKATILAFEAMGVDMTPTKEKLDFGFSGKDIVTRYGGSFIGGAIGGGVFELSDRIDYRRTGATRLIDLNTEQRLLWFLRNKKGDEIKKEIERLYKKGLLGNKNLSVLKKRDVADITNSNDGQTVTVYGEGTEKDNQNLLMYTSLMDEINALEHFLASNKFKMSDEELLRRIMQIEADEDLYKKEMQKLSHPLISKIIELGLTDVVTNNVDYILATLNNLDAQIAQRELELRNSIPDGSDKESQISKDLEIKNLKTQYDKIKKELDDILDGKHADYYVEFGLAIADKNFKEHFTKGKNAAAYSDIANYYWLSTGKQFNDLNEEDKNNVIQEYNSFTAASEYSAQKQQFDLFRAVNERYSKEISKSVKELQNAVYDPEYSSDIYGDVEERIKKLNQSKAELEKKLETIEDPNIRQNIVDSIDKINHDIQVFENIKQSEVLDRIRVKNVDVPSIGEYLKQRETFKVLTERITELENAVKSLGEIPDLTQLEPIVNELSERTKEASEFQKQLNQLRENVKTETKAYFSKMVSDKVVKFGTDSVIKEVIDFLIETSEGIKDYNYNVYNITEDTFSLAHTSADYKSFLENIFANPLDFNFYYNDLIDTLLKRTSDDLGEQIAKENVIIEINRVLNGLPSELEQFINKILEYKRELPKTPLTDLIQDLHVGMTGKPLQIIEMLNSEWDRLINSEKINDYTLARGDVQVKEIENALRLLDVISNSLDAASNGYNAEANKFRIGDGKVKLAEMPDNVAQIYHNEINTLRQRLQYLKTLHEKNNSAQAKKQFNIMLNVEPKLIGSLFDKKGEINRELEIDLDDLWEEVANGISYGSDVTMESHPDFKHVKIEFEKRLFEEIAKKRWSSDKLAEKIFNIYKSDKTLWHCQAGEFTDSLKELPVFTQMMYLSSIVSSNSNTFTVKLNENVLNNIAFEKYTLFFSHEYAIRCVWAQMQNLDFYNSLLSQIKTQIPKGDKYLEELFVASNVAFVTGGPGTGKSSAVGLAIKLLAESDNGKVIGIAKFGKQVKSLQKNLQIKESEAILFSKFESEVTKDLNDLYTIDCQTENVHPHILNKGVKTFNELELFDKVKGSKVIVVDEFTFFAEGEIQLLSKYAEKNKVLIVGLGDPKQNQISVSDGKGKSLSGFEDCIIIDLPALTVSMRVSNTGKDTNNMKLDASLSRCIEYIRSHKEESPAKWNEEMKKQGLIPDKIEFIYSDDEDGFFGDKHETFNESNKIEKVKEWIEKLNSIGKTVALITDDKDLNSLENSVDIIDPFNVQGAEYDYVIVLKKSWDTDQLGNANNHFLFMRDILTMSSRAKIGSVLLSNETQSQFSKLIPVVSNSTPAAKMIVNSETDTRFVEIRQKYNNYIKALYAEYVSDSEPENIPQTDDFTSDDDIDPNQYLNDDKEFEAPEEEFSAGDVINAYDYVDESGSVLKYEDLPDKVKSLVRRSDYKAYLDRKGTLSNNVGTIYLDVEEFITLLYSDSDKDLGIYEKGPFNNNMSDAYLNSYKRYIQIATSILMYDPNGTERTEALTILDNTLDDKGESSISDYKDSIKRLLRGQDDSWRFNVREFNSEKSLIYCENDDYIIPIGVIPKTTSGEYTDIIFEEQIGVIGLSSNGAIHSDLRTVEGNSVFQGKEGGIFSPDVNTRNEFREESGYDAPNIGKPTVYVSYKPWLKPSDVYQFRLQEGKRDYTIQHDKELKLIDVQKRIKFKDFVELCRQKYQLLYGKDIFDDTTISDKNEKSSDITVLQKTLGIDADLLSIIKSKPSTDNTLVYTEWAKVAYPATQILTSQSQSHLISTLVQYYLLYGSDTEKSQIIKNLSGYIVSENGWVSNTDNHVYNRSGFSIRLYKDDGPTKHSYYDDFFFEYTTNGYNVYKSTWDANEVFGYTIESIATLVVKTLLSEDPFQFFTECFNVIKSSYGEEVGPRGLSETSLRDALEKNDVSIIPGIKSDTYREPILQGLPLSGIDSTNVWPMSETSIISKLLRGIDVENTSKLEEFFKNNSMFKYNMYLALSGEEYYHMNNGQNNMKVSAHKKFTKLDGITSDYVKFFAPVFSVKGTCVNSTPIQHTKPESNLIYTSPGERFYITGDKNGIKIEIPNFNSVTGEKITETFNARVLSVTRDKMWIEFNEQIIQVDGTFEGKVPNARTTSFVHKYGDLYFFKGDGDGHFISIDSSVFPSITNGTPEQWILIFGELRAYPNNDKGLTSEDIPDLRNIFGKPIGIHKSDDFKLDVKGNVISGKLSISKAVAKRLFDTDDVDNITITRIDFLERYIEFKQDGKTIIKKIEVESPIEILLDLTSDDFSRDIPSTELDKFKNKLSRQLSINSTLNTHANEILMLINNDIQSSIDEINMFLEENKFRFGAEYILAYDGNKLEFKKIETPETTVALLLNQKTIEFGSITILNMNTDSFEACNSIEFLVSLSDGSQKSGFLTKNNNQWNLNLRENFDSNVLDLQKDLENINPTSFATENDYKNAISIIKQIVSEVNETGESDTYNAMNNAWEENKWFLGNDSLAEILNKIEELINSEDNCNIII